MKSVKNILEQGRFEVPDNGFSQRVMSVVYQMTPAKPSYRITPRRISLWLEFRLPMIGVAVGVLLVGFIMSHYMNLGASWGENYLHKTELLSQQLFSSLDEESSTNNTSDSECNPQIDEY